MSDIKKFSNYQKIVVAILIFLQFTIILDFMIISPLGAVLMPALKMSAKEFGYVVSAYAFSAGLSGLMAAGFADRFDRKKMLLFFYTGFIIGTFLCGIAMNYQFLLFARIFTGLFGGVIGSIVLAITADLFAFELRGRVMGLLQTAFASSQVLGIPLSLYLSNHFGWHWPFMLIVTIGAFVGIIIFKYLKPVDGHLKLKTDHFPIHHMLATVKNSKYLNAFATTALVSLGGFLIMPFASAFTVHNLGISMEQLPMIYLSTGIASLFMGPMIGRASDQFGKFKVFIFGAIVTVGAVLVYTNLGITPLAHVIMTNIVMFVGIFSRMIPSQALMSAIPKQVDRGSFMAINSSMQQIAGGLASVISGSLIIVAVDGHITNFYVLGYVMTVTTAISILLMYRIHKYIPEK